MTRRTKCRLAALLGSLALVLAADCLAQRLPGRDRGESPREAQRRDREARPAAAPAVLEPFGTLERELPSLKADLRLTAQQAQPWSLFERGVREAAELERVRRRHALALRDRDDRPPSAQKVLEMFAEDDRQKAQASADLGRYFQALYAALDEAQQRMLDRRVVLSQSEPLGSEGPSQRR